LYTGVWYGAFGGFLACLLVSIGFYILGSGVEVLSLSYQSDFKLQGLGFLDWLGLMLVSTGLGLIGAWLAVGRHLSEIEPR